MLRTFSEQKNILNLYNPDLKMRTWPIWYEDDQPVVENAPEDPAEPVEDVADDTDHGVVMVVVDEGQPGGEYMI